MPLAEHGQLAVSLADQIAVAPGVRAAIPDVAVPSEIRTGGIPGAVEIHPWSAARLTPFTLTAGSAPNAASEVVLDRQLASRIGARPGQQVQLALPSGLQTFTVAGIAAPTGAATDVATVFVNDAEAATLLGHPAPSR